MPSIKDGLEYQKGTDLGKGEISQFRYAPLIGPDILTGILVNVTGQSVLEFAYENLFSPMEIDVTQNVVFNSKEERQTARIFRMDR